MYEQVKFNKTKLLVLFFTDRNSDGMDCTVCYVTV